MNKKLLFLGAIAVLLVIFLAGARLYNQSQSGAGGPVSRATLATLDRAHAPSLGAVCRGILRDCPVSSRTYVTKSGLGKKGYRPRQSLSLSL